MIADAAYRSPTWRTLAATVSFTTRLASNATLYAPAPPPAGKRGRPRTKGHRLGKPADLAKAADWKQASIDYYGKTHTVYLALVACLWYGSLRTTPVHVILVRAANSTKAYDIALVTTDAHATAEQIMLRYAARWSIEQAIKDGKNLLGAGDAQNRAAEAVTRTVPFAMLCQAILILWYHRAGTATADLAAARALRPWHRHKTHISIDDMLIAFRRARITVVSPAHDTRSQTPIEAMTSTSAAA